MEASCVWILSLVCIMDRRMLFNLGLASSAISSSDKIQRLISFDRSVRGERRSKYSVNESSGRSSRFFRPYDLMRATFSSMEAIFNSSGMESVLPISRDLMEKPRSRLLPKEVLPAAKRRPMASAVFT